MSAELLLRGGHLHDDCTRRLLIQSQLGHDHLAISVVVHSSVIHIMPSIATQSAVDVPMDAPGSTNGHLSACTIKVRLP